MGRRARHHDLTAFSGALDILYSAPDLLSLPHRVIKTLGRIFRVEQVSFTLIDAASGQFVFSLVDPLPAGWAALRPAVEAHSHLHPLAQFIPSQSAKTGALGGSARISDAISLNVWRRHPLYNAYFRAVGLDRQMASLDMVDPARVLSVTVDRGGRDFSEEERQIFDLLRPHLWRVYRTAHDHEQMRADLAAARAPRGLILSGGEPPGAAGEAALCEVDADGRLRWGDAQTAAMLARYNLGARPLSGRAPHLLQRFLKGLRRPHASGWDERRLGIAARSWRVPGEQGGELTVHAVGGDAESEHRQLILREEKPASPGASKAGQAPLTPREREVLGWVARGKTNWEVGKILTISPKTVSKHLERVYEKLGVENRTAAARSWVQAPPGGIGPVSAAE